MAEYNFDDIRPYRDSEINAAMLRIIESPLFNEVASYLYADYSVDQVKDKFKKFNCINDFQSQVMHHAMNFLIKKSITDFTYSGLEQLDNRKSYLFISNHRDIILDSGLFQVALYDNGFKPTEITFGSNLMSPDFVVDLGKSNKMFKVERGGSPRDFYHNSMHLSRYIRHAIMDRDESIWIAQRNGRTKNGIDATDQGILKMFCMSGKKNIIENLSDLHIVPLSISYQWETCDTMKVNELYKSRTEKYIKKPGEDLQSILTGLTQFKGSVHIEITPPLTSEELGQFSGCEKNDCYNTIAKLIDNRIHSNYKLFDTNYIALDIENNSTDYLNEKYTDQSRNYFKSEMQRKLSSIEGEIDILKAIYLGIYSNPIKNKLD